MLSLLFVCLGTLFASVLLLAVVHFNEANLANSKHFFFLFFLIRKALGQVAAPLFSVALMG